MKTSFCSIAYRGKRVPFREIILKIAECGYDAVEIWGQHLLNSPSVQELKHNLGKANLKVSVISPYFNFTGNPSGWKKSIERAEYFIEYAYNLKASALRCFTGLVGSRQSGEHQWQSCTTGIKVIADMADRKGIEIFIETHPDTLADTTESIRRLLKDINRKNVGLIFDMYNMWESEPENLFNSFVTLYPYIRHIHLKNANTGKEKKNPFSLVHTRGADLSTISYLNNGDINYEKYLAYLKNKNFDGYLSVEWFGDSVEKAALHELNFLKRSFLWGTVNGKKNSRKTVYGRQELHLGI